MGPCPRSQRARHSTAAAANLAHRNRSARRPSDPPAPPLACAPRLKALAHESLGPGEPKCTKSSSRQDDLPARPRERPQSCSASRRRCDSGKTALALENQGSLRELSTVDRRSFHPPAVITPAGSSAPRRRRPLATWSVAEKDALPCRPKCPAAASLTIISDYSGLFRFIAERQKLERPRQ